MAGAEREVIKREFGGRAFRVREAVGAGVPRHVVYRLRDEGVLISVSRGVMQSADTDPAMNAEFAAVAARVPKATICLNSGLSYWDLSDELPGAVHLAVARGSHWPKIDTPATTLHRFAAATFEVDRLKLATDGGDPFWIYSAERCVVDAMRLQRVTGRDVALSALRRYMRRDDANPLRLTELARDLGGARQMARALELILA